MFSILVDAASGVIGAVLGYLVAKAVADRKTRRQLNNAVFLIVFIAGLRATQAIIGPPVRAWETSREVEAYLQTDQTFRRVLQDNPHLREPVRAAFIKAYATGDRQQAAELGHSLLSGVFAKYLSRT